MKPQQEHIEQIRDAFSKLQTREDLLLLLNEVKPLIYGEKAVPFQIKQLTWYANPNLGGKRYSEFKIRKKSGGERSIHAPVKGLKAIQRTLAFILQCVFEPHKAATGFVRDKSIVDNALPHVGKHYVYNIDLKDFFPTIEQARVWKCLQLKPFNLGGERTKLASVIAGLCCTEMEVERQNANGEWEKVKRNVLPQGAPTSPVITNMVCQRLDHLLSGVAKRFGLTYSRYADDITFSSMHNVYQGKGDFLTELRRIIVEQGFYIKESKTRLQKDGYRKEVTGLLVHEKPNVPKRYIKQLRMWLYYWERYGYEKASALFSRQYMDDKGHVKKGAPAMENVLAGKLEYLKMVKGRSSRTYTELFFRFEKIEGAKTIIEDVIDTWESKGIDMAAEKYYKLKT
jgi:RNA-directed DNA polymerase